MKSRRMYPLTESTDHEKVTNDFFRQRTKKKKKIIRLEQAKITISVPIRAGLNGLTLRPPRSHYRCCPGKKRKKKKREKYDGSISVYRIDGNGGNGSSGFRKRSPLYCRRNEIYFELCIFYSLSLNRSYFFYQKNT